MSQKLHLNVLTDSDSECGTLSDLTPYLKITFEDWASIHVIFGVFSLLYLTGGVRCGQDRKIFPIEFRKISPDPWVMLVPINYIFFYIIIIIFSAKIVCMFLLTVWKLDSGFSIPITGTNEFVRFNYNAISCI